MGMDPREALARIRDIHRPADMMGEVGCEVCNRDSDNWQYIEWPCETRRLCDEVLSPGEYVTADPWPETLPGAVTEPLDGAGLIAGDTSKVTMSTQGFARPDASTA